VILTDFHWYTVDDANFGFNGTDDVLITLPDGSGGAPGTVVVDQRDIKNTREDTGVDLFSRNVYLYTIDGTSIELDAGNYYVGMRAVADTFSVRSFILTSPLTGSDSWFRSEYYGYPDWNQTSNIYGEAKNHAFCLTGFVDVCQDAIYDNGAYDRVNSYTSQRSLDPDWIESRTVDDVQFNRPVVITDFHWYTQDRSAFDWNGTDDVVILKPDAAGAPGEVIRELRDYPNSREDTGETIFGDPIYL
jgi:hypothetical protein